MYRPAVIAVVAGQHINGCALSSLCLLIKYSLHMHSKELKLTNQLLSQARRQGRARPGRARPFDVFAPALPSLPPKK